MSRDDAGALCVDPHDMFEQAFIKIIRKREALIVLTSTVILSLQVKKYWTTRATQFSAYLVSRRGGVKSNFFSRDEGRE